MLCSLRFDEPGDDFELWKLLCSGLGPHIVCWYVSSPVDPIPGSSSGNVLQDVLYCPERKVTLPIGSPVPGLPLPPAGRTRLVPTTQGLLAVGCAASFVRLLVESVHVKTTPPRSSGVSTGRTHLVPVDVCQKQHPALWWPRFRRGWWDNWGLGDLGQGDVPGCVHVKFATGRTHQQSTRFTGPQQRLLQGPDEVVPEQLRYFQTHLLLGQMETDARLPYCPRHSLFVGVTLGEKQRCWSFWRPLTEARQTCHKTHLC